MVRAIETMVEWSADFFSVLRIADKGFLIMATEQSLIASWKHRSTALTERLGMCHASTLLFLDGSGENHGGVRVRK